MLEKVTRPPWAVVVIDDRSEMANLTCPKCGCPIAVDRGIRLGSVVYCCQPCVDSQPCEFGCSPDRDPAKGAGGVGVILHEPDFTQRLTQ
jgi:hypothetical protein